MTGSTTLTNPTTPSQPAAAAGRPGDSASPAVSFSAVSKVFPARSGPGVTALQDVDLQVRRGEIFAVVGRSGAGKSTLVRLINGLERPTSGRVSVAGTDISTLTERQLRPIRRRIGMVFQQFNLMRSRTVVGNIAFPLRVAGVDKAARERRVAELLDFVGLREKAWQYPDQLSGGQKQRIGIARALATEPTLLLADESTSALDPETTSEVLALLRRVNRELGITIVVITHEMDVVRSTADRVAVLEAGRVAEVGQVQQVFARPTHHTSRRFVQADVRQQPDADRWGQLRRQHPAKQFGQLVSPDAGLLSRVLVAGAELGVPVEVVHGGVSTFKDGDFSSFTLGIEGPEPAVAQWFSRAHELAAQADGMLTRVSGPASGGDATAGASTGTDNTRTDNTGTGSTDHTDGKAEERR
ncbi:methionine ABC transporter ATP-binding protein [Nakamurella aerolata]|uniref:Methionine ABC transporter ATP-binding protein n=1 Tax=Nakamurella aerolata TaxID=1656892 RepID=A0A849AFN9_9ACTN|nr:methionine ABC transporter ATP-binding protein [Nakamurella aerolata]NNG35652.1 methionine ABC transporter ATP-binding protein [Nakamurella aerolata]